MKNRNFTYAAMCAAMLTAAASVSTRAEELRSPAADTVSTRLRSVRSVMDTAVSRKKSTYAVADTVSARYRSTSPAVDTSALQSGSTQLVADTGLTRARLRHKIDYTGVALSAFVPGSGQIYQSRYVMGGLFLTAEASAVGFAVYWSGSADTRFSNAGRLRGVSDSLSGLGQAAGNDTAARNSLLYSAGRYSVLADEAAFEARSARYTAYNALAWAAGMHLYNVLDALEAGGLTARGLEKSPTAAGLLAAVPFLGLGQLYNERPSKAGMLAMAQIGLAYTALNQHLLMDIASYKYNQMRDSASAQYAYRADHLNYWKSRYDKAFSGRNTYLWLSLAAYLYSILDALVDAHLSDFNAKIDLGTDLAVTPIGGGVAVNVTMSLKRPP